MLPLTLYAAGSLPRDHRALLFPLTKGEGGASPRGWHWLMVMSLLLIVALVMLSSNSAHAKSCGSASCPLNTHNFLRGGWLSLSYAHEYINQDRLYLGSSKSYAGAVRELHDEVSTLNNRDVVRLQLGIVDRLAFEVNVPFVRREHSHIFHGERGTLNQWETWNFSGLGDISVLGHYALLLPEKLSDPYLGIVGGVKLPSGVTDAKNAEGEQAEVTIQPGTGSVDEIIGANFRMPLITVPTLNGEYGSLPIDLLLLYQMNGKGTNDYRFGNSLQAHIGTAYQLTRKLNVLLQLNGRFQDFADVGNTDEPRENTGGTWIFASPGIGLNLTDDLSGVAYLQLPVYENVHGLQQTAPFNLFLGLSYQMNIFGEDDGGGEMHD